MANWDPRIYLKLDGYFQDVTSDVSQVDPLKTSVGGPEMATPKPSSIDLTFEDPLRVYQPHRPSSPLYGRAGRNTPVLVADLGVLEDFETLPLKVAKFDITPATPWLRSTTSPHSGTYCYKSGAIGNSANSDVALYAPAGSNACLMWYRTDCAATDLLEITTCGGRVDVLTASGTGGVWTQLLVPVYDDPGGAGTYIYFRYIKDASGTGGADAVYIDDLQFIHSRAVGEAGSWSPDETLGSSDDGTRGRRWTALHAEGPLGRIGSWSDEVQSCMYRAVSGLSDLTGFWPCEDASGSAVVSSALPLVVAATTQEVSLGDTDAPAGGSTSASISSGSGIFGAFRYVSTTAWQVSLSFKLDATPANATYENLLATDAIFGYEWLIQVNNTSYRVDVRDSSGSVSATNASYGTFGAPTQWITIVLAASMSGGTTTYALSWYAQEAPVIYTLGSSFAGTSGCPRSWRVLGNQHTDGMKVAYIYGVNNNADVLALLHRSFDGYNGELAFQRFTRLMRESGEAKVTIYDGVDSATMGPQKPDSLINLLREIRDTDGGLLHDAPNCLAVQYTTRKMLYRQPVSTFLIGSLEEVAPPFIPVYDGQDIANEVTVQNRGGGTYVAVDSTSEMSNQPPPLGVNAKKTTFDTNFELAYDAEEMANWAMRIGTLPGARYPTITTDLDATPYLESDYYQAKPGTRFQVFDVEEDTIDVMITGINDDQDNSTRRRVTYSAIPYLQYQTGQYDSTTEYYGSKSTTLNTSINSTTTTVVFRVADRDGKWSTTSDYNVVIGGEEMAVTAMGALTGSSAPYTQTATVTRSVNTVVKSHTAGAPINVYPPNQARYAL